MTSAGLLYVKDWQRQPRPTASIQLREALCLIAVTFLGMALIVPANFGEHRRFMERTQEQICRPERFQFTMSEMLLTLVASFFGMALLIPIMFRENRIVGCVIVECVTVACALVSLRWTRVSTPGRGAFIFCSAVCGWTLVLLSPVLISERFLEIIAPGVTVAIVVSPLAIGLFIAFRRKRRAEQERRKSKGVVGPLLLSSAISLVFYLLLLPAFLRSRMAPAEVVGAAECRAYAEAQEIYHRTDYTGNGVLKYAQHLSGNDSLLEKTAGAGDLALIDKSYGNAEIGSYMLPKCGYVFKILTAQGLNAPGGRKSYIDSTGNMTGGYALIARPWVYGANFTKCFMIDRSGIILEADLGPNTAAIVDKMTEFDPDPRWQPTQ
jgi:hypothetical protein